LKSGTNNTKPEIKKLFISSTEVCHILSECQKAGVSSLNFDSQGLKVEFAQAGPQVKEDLSAELPDHDEINQKTLAVEEQRTRDEQLALLQIEDPQEFERQLAAEEMSDEKSFEYEES
jgi:hypothetical protein